MISSDKLFDHRNHGGNRFGRARDDMGAFDTKLVEIVQERSRIEVGDFLERLAGVTDFIDDAVFNVGDVYHVRDIESPVCEPAAQQIVEHERPQIADVNEVVHGRAAGVHADVRWFEWNEFLLRPRKRVEEFHISTEAIATTTMPSSRPVNPMCSLVVALTPTCVGATPRFFPRISCIFGMCGAIFGAWAIIIASMLLIRPPACLTRSAHSFTMTMLFMSLNFISLGG